MKELQTFAMNLMDHVRNENKTSIESVKASLATWQQKEDERMRTAQEAFENYMNQHEIPRQERDAAYANYLQDKTLAYDSISKAPTSLRKQRIMQWLRIPMPDTLKEGLLSDLIYTSGR